MSKHAKQSPCFSCDGFCCGSYSIELTAFDIRRLMQGLELVPEEFCTTLRSWVGRCMITPSIIKGEEVNLVLKHSSQNFCLFFRGGTKACGVYENRPRVCAVYPFHFAKGWALTERADALCPVSWKGSIDANKMASVLEQLEREVCIHNELVKRLISQGIGEDGFSAYLNHLLTILPHSTE